jgi:acyl-phosphate glycerol 3-phosphate acyltransferase
MTTAFVMAAVAAYLLGSIPFGYLLVRAVRKQDIRSSGSGNIGATNVLRSGARGLGILTLVLDAGKGYAAVALVRMEAARHLGAGPQVAELAALAATYAVVGHVYPIWLRGKGGKGVATALGVFLALAPLSALCAAAMFLLVVFLLASLLLKKSFCGWLCPVGTVSETLWKFGRRILGRSLRVPGWLDYALRSLKYVLLAFFGLIIGTMSAQALAGFMDSSYGIIADVKMLDFFRELSLTGILILAALVLLSVLIENFWCRYLCPYGALMGLVSLLSPTKIRRDQEACIDCGKCSRACPSHLPVDQLVQIRSVECTACMACVASCPVENGLQFALPPRKSESIAARWRGRIATPQMVAILLACLFFGTVLMAKATGHWNTNVPRQMYMVLVPHADEVAHPM